MIYESFFEV